MRWSLVLFAACLACTDAVGPQTIAITDAVGESRGGAGVVIGEIQFPGTIGVDRRLTLSLFAQGYTSSRSATVEEGNFIRYRIEGVPDGGYFVGAAVDINGDEALDEADWAGFAGGTTAAPVLRRANAKQVALVAGGEAVLDIAVGVVATCLMPREGICASDSDCRYVSCDCPADAATATPERTIFFLPTCPKVSRVCTLPANANCDTACAPTPGPELEDGPCLRDLDLTSARAD